MITLYKTIHIRNESQYKNNPVVCNIKPNVQLFDVEKMDNGEQSK